jgi:hypothetical protein
MKNLIFGLIATVLFSINSTGQTTKESWLKMIENHKENVDRILSSEKPKDVDLKKIKEQIVLGERKLSERSSNELIKSSIPLKAYASEFTQKNKILVENDDELIFYAGFYPEFPITDDLIEALGGPGLTADEVWDCAVEAVGLGFVTAIGAAGIKATGIKVFTKAITKFITKFAGPLGAAITVADFGFCLYGQSLD